MAGDDILAQALARLDEAAKIVQPPADVLEALKAPKETLKARLTILGDDGVLRSFTAWRCRYDDSRGPTKGGVRFHPAASVEEVESLAFWMTFKCAVAGLPFGGGKGAVRVDPDTLSPGELERLARAYVRAMAPVIGPQRDIPAPDVSTNAQVMDWMADEYGRIVGHPEPAIVTGKSLAAGGSEGRKEATGRGGFEVFKRLAPRLGLSGPCRVSVQGLGNVGLVFAQAMAEAGHIIVAASDSKSALSCPAGLDMTAIALAKAEGRPLAALARAGVSAGAPDSVLEADCDLLVPAALENAITEANAAEVRAKAILELANGPTTPAADAILADRGVTVVPDILANSGGVIVSYFEWLQNRRQEHWSLDAVNARLAEALAEPADSVWLTAEAKAVSLRTAAYVRGLGALVEAMRNGPHFAPAEKSSLAAG